MQSSDSVPLRLFRQSDISKPSQSGATWRSKLCWAGTAPSENIGSPAYSDGSIERFCFAQRVPKPVDAVLRFAFGAGAPGQAERCLQGPCPEESL